MLYMEFFATYDRRNADPVRAESELADSKQTRIRVSMNASWVILYKDPNADRVS